MLSNQHKMVLKAYTFFENKIMELKMLFRTFPTFYIHRDNDIRKNNTV